MKRRKYGLFGVGIALVVIFLTPFASDQPDGLNRVAADHGFASASRTAQFRVLSGYDVPGVGTYWDGVISGFVGVAVVGFVLYLLTRLLAYAKK